MKIFAYTGDGFLFNAKKIDSQGKFNLQLALTEMLMNGVEHGNCAIGFDRKYRYWGK